MIKSQETSNEIKISRKALLAGRQAQRQFIAKKREPVSL
jgi:hypothetical protein